MIFKSKIRTYFLFCYNSYTLGGENMEPKNKLNEVPLANISDQELDKIKRLEEDLGDKYYLIAFNRD